MDDSADIAGGLSDRWLAPSVVALFADEFGGDAGDARTAVSFLSGIHDLGKATPSRYRTSAWRTGCAGTACTCPPPSKSCLIVNSPTIPWPDTTC